MKIVEKWINIQIKNTKFIYDWYEICYLPIWKLVPRKTQFVDLKLNEKIKIKIKWVKITVMSVENDIDFHSIFFAGFSKCYRKNFVHNMNMIAKKFILNLAWSLSWPIGSFINFHTSVEIIYYFALVMKNATLYVNVVSACFL